MDGEEAVVLRAMLPEGQGDEADVPAFLSPRLARRRRHPSATKLIDPEVRKRLDKTKKGKGLPHKATIHYFFRNNSQDCLDKFGFSAKRNIPIDGEAEGDEEPGDEFEDGDKFEQGDEGEHHRQTHEFEQRVDGEKRRLDRDASSSDEEANTAHNPALNPQAEEEGSDAIPAAASPTIRSPLKKVRVEDKHVV